MTDGNQDLKPEQAGPEADQPLDALVTDVHGRLTALSNELGQEGQARRSFMFRTLPSWLIGGYWGGRALLGGGALAWMASSFFSGYSISDKLAKDVVDVAETLTNSVNRKVAATANEVEESTQELLARPYMRKTGMVGEGGVLDNEYIDRLEQVVKTARLVGEDESGIERIQDLITKIKARHADALIRLYQLDQASPVTDPASRGFIEAIRTPFRHLIFGKQDTVERKREISINNMRHYMQETLRVYENVRSGKIAEAEGLNRIYELSEGIRDLDQPEKAVVDEMIAKAGAGQLDNVREYIMTQDPTMLGVESRVVYEETLLPWMEDTTTKLEQMKDEIDDVERLQKKRKKGQEIADLIRENLDMKRAAATDAQEYKAKMNKLEADMRQYNNDMQYELGRLRDRGYEIDDRYALKVFNMELPLGTALKFLTAGTIGFMWFLADTAYTKTLGPVQKRLSNVRERERDRESRQLQRQTDSVRTELKGLAEQVGQYVKPKEPPKV